MEILTGRLIDPVLVWLAVNDVLVQLVPERDLAYLTRRGRIAAPRVAHCRVDLQSGALEKRCHLCLALSENITGRRQDEWLQRVDYGRRSRPSTAPDPYRPGNRH